MLFSCDKIKNKKLSAGKKQSDFSFDLYDSVAAINSEDWNIASVHGSEFLKIPYLSVLEKERPDNMNFHYAVMYQNNRPAAIAYFQVIDLSSASFGSMIEQDSTEFSCAITRYLKKHLTNHLIQSADKANMRLLICGNTFISGEHGFSCIPEIDKTEMFDALADVIFQICSIEKTRCKISAILIKDFYTSQKNISDELKEFKYHDFLVEPNMIVNVNWKTFDEYLDAMSKKYRSRAKGIIKKGIELERKNFSAADINENALQIQNLYNNVLLKASFRMAGLSAAYFTEMKKTLGDKFNFTAYYHDGKIIGFRTSFLLKDSIEAHFIGLNYELNKELELYQNILYDYVKDAIDNNRPQLFLGRTASEIKSNVGAEAYQLSCYVRHRNPLSNHIIKPFIDSIKPTEWIPRNPFKEVVMPVQY